MLDGIPHLTERNQSFVDGGERLCQRNFAENALLGAGSFAKVRRVTSLSTGKSYAMKILSLKQIKQLKLLEQLRNELGILAMCQHPNIIALHGAFAEDEQVFLLLELADGSLFDKLVKRFPLSEERVASYMRDIVRAVVYLHSLAPPILHRDLKPENVLVCGGRCKIADFGWSNADNARRNTYCGTFDYLAPEMILGTGHNEKLDVWTLGVLMYELLEGRPPFGPQEKSVDKRLVAKITEKNILSGTLTFNRKLSAEAMAAIRQIVNIDESKRPFAREILELDFFRSAARPRSRNPTNAGSSRVLAPLAAPPRAAAPPSPPKSARAKTSPPEKAADPRGPLKARVQMLEARNKDLSRLLQEKNAQLQARAARAPSETDRELAEVKEKIAILERKAQEKLRSAQFGVHSAELKSAAETNARLTAVNTELVEMVYAFAKRPPPTFAAFDRAALAAVKAELHSAYARQLDARRRAQPQTHYVLDGGHYRVLARSKSRDNQRASADREKGAFALAESQRVTPPNR